MQSKNIEEFENAGVFYLEFGTKYSTGLKDYLLSNSYFRTFTEKRRPCRSGLQRGPN